MAKFVKDDYGNIYKLDICKCGNCMATCLVPVDTGEYKVRVFEKKMISKYEQVEPYKSCNKH